MRKKAGYGVGAGGTRIVSSTSINSMSINLNLGGSNIFYVHPFVGKINQGF